MASRGHEAPMDFEWQGLPPVDLTSPFVQHTLAHSDNNLKRSHDAFSSPQKPSFPTPQTFGSQSSIFSTLPASNPNPFSQYRNPSFTTPRKPHDIDFSSGPENPSSPEQADNEDTPEPKPMMKFNANDSKSKRNPLRGLDNKYAPPKLSSYSDAKVGRIHKRRKAERFDKQIMRREMRRHSGDSSEDEKTEESKSERKRQNVSPPKEVGFIPFLFGIGHRIGDLISKHPDAYSPRRITEYAWALCNCAIVLGGLYILLNVLSAVQKDMTRGNDLAVARLTTQMAACRSHYEINGCGGPRPPPALEQDCAKWDVCMNQDPQAIQGARIGAATWAAIMNGFVDELKWKTIAFVVIFMAVMNLTFGGIYKLTPPQPSPAPSQFSHGAYPPPYNLNATPYGAYGYQNLGWRHDQDGRPWDANGRAIEYSQQRSPSREYNDRARSRSPVKDRLTWE